MQVKELLKKLEQSGIYIDGTSVFHFIFDAFLRRKRLSAEKEIALSILVEVLKENRPSESENEFRSFLKERIKEKIIEKKAEVYDSKEELEELARELEKYRKILSLYKEKLLDNEQMVKIINENFTVDELDYLRKKLGLEIIRWYYKLKYEKIRAIMDEAKSRGVYDKLEEEIFNKIKSAKIELEKKRTNKEERIKNIPKEIEDLNKFTEELSAISIKDILLMLKDCVRESVTLLMKKRIY